MPSIVVRIKWDIPDDPNWLNAFNVQLALADYCRNTAFEVEEVRKRIITTHDEVKKHSV